VSRMKDPYIDLVNAGMIELANTAPSLTWSTKPRANTHQRATMPGAPTMVLW
jgi:hypothetical protein